MAKQDFKLYTDSWALRSQHGDGPFSFLKSKLTSEDLRRLRGISPSKSRYLEIPEEKEEEKELAPIKWKSKSSSRFYYQGLERAKEPGERFGDYIKEWRNRNTRNYEESQRIGAASIHRQSEEPDLKTPLGRNIYETVFQKNTPDTEPNDLFLPGRMTYLVDLNDEAESDVPLTVIRDKADCPILEPHTLVNTSDAIISRLSQVFSRVRQDIYGKKYRKKELGEKRPFEASYTFYNIGERAPWLPKTTWEKIMARSREYPGEKSKESNREWLREQAFKAGRRRRYRALEKSRVALRKELESTMKLMKTLSIQSSRLEGTESLKKLDLKKHLGSFYPTNSYMECYPAKLSALEKIHKEKKELHENEKGYRKDHLHRGDFETQEEYREYLRNRISSKNVIAMIEEWKTWRFREDYDKAKNHRQKKKKEGRKPEVKKLKYPSPVVPDENPQSLPAEIPNKDTR
ncbi:protein Red-like [Perognathus longimembris pacificus]|uniref:protein Red-like n=1 Tax=Perognathus longimembris pacificus TaxID=214514 RepID=UPI0020191B0D|nr:protein Red-like [Perognathus longimembris pacificus]